MVLLLAVPLLRRTASVLLSKESEAVIPVRAKVNDFIMVNQPVRNERNQSRSQRSECKAVQESNGSRKDRTNGRTRLCREESHLGKPVLLIRVKIRVTHLRTASLRVFEDLDSPAAMIMQAGSVDRHGRIESALLTLHHRPCPRNMFSFFE